MRKCIACGEEKPLEAFGVSKRCKDGKLNVCKPCLTIQAKERRHRNPRTLLGRRFTDIKKRARRRKEKLCITLDDLIELYKKQHGLCALTKIPMSWAHDGEHSNSAERRGTSISVDRIDPTVGYTKNNIRLVCERANKVKSNMTDDELYFWTRQISYNLNSFSETD